MGDGVVLRLRDVGVDRAGTRILHAVDWTVREGERWVVLGPNGAGKTTLMRLAAAALRPSSGTTEVLGEPLATADLPELRTRIGLCSAAVADRVDRGEPVVDLVVGAAFGRIGTGPEPGGAEDVARARELLGQLGCTGLAARRYGSLSEGERKRVEIARALMADPELLLLDEPAAGLDLGAREALLRRLARLAADPAAPVVVLVTHHVEEIPPGVTHALLLRRGRVVAAGPVGAVLTAPVLSACFALPLTVAEQAGRWSARMALAS